MVKVKYSKDLLFGQLGTRERENPQLNPFKVIGGHFDPEKLKNYKIKFISIAFEDFKKSLKELEQKVGVAWH